VVYLVVILIWRFGGFFGSPNLNNTIPEAAHQIKVMPTKVFDQSAKYSTHYIATYIHLYSIITLSFITYI